MDAIDDNSETEELVSLPSKVSFTCGLCSEIHNSYDDIISHHSEKHPAYYPGTLLLLIAPFPSTPPLPLCGKSCNSCHAVIVTKYFKFYILFEEQCWLSEFYWNRTWHKFFLKLGHCVVCYLFIKTCNKSGVLRPCAGRKDCIVILC